jgi:protein-S-isoprenylcysteine O-methyltransferase Ste14
MAAHDIPRYAEPRFLRHLSSIALLPFMNTIVMPWLLLTASGDSKPLWQAAGSLAVWLMGVSGLTFLITGGTLVIGSIMLFMRLGHGTLAPWDPPKTLVVEGLYSYCRNPMKVGLFSVLAAEALLLRSLTLLLWLTVFVAANVVYIRLSEEPGLYRRFGASYAEYCRSVPRWLPRIRIGRRASAPTKARSR